MSKTPWKKLGSIIYSEPDGVAVAIMANRAMNTDNVKRIDITDEFDLAMEDAKTIFEAVNELAELRMRMEMRDATVKMLLEQHEADTALLSSTREVLAERDNELIDLRLKLDAANARAEVARKIVKDLLPIVELAQFYAPGELGEFPDKVAAAFDRARVWMASQQPAAPDAHLESAYDERTEGE